MHVAALQRRDRRRPAAAPASSPAAESGAIVRLLTCGSVDDGKSTLIGRLLWDVGRASPRISARPSCTPRRTARSTARRSISACCSTASRPSASRASPSTSPGAISRPPDRRFVIIDAPGHEQYTRNMATGASHADVAILLVDARHGVKRQTRRHAAICDLVGIKKVVLAVNKMDLIDWSEEALPRHRGKTSAPWPAASTLPQIAAIPVAALPGDNVVRRSSAMPWYSGPTLLDYLETVDAECRAARRALPLARAARARATATSAAMPAPWPRAASGLAIASSMREAGSAPRCAASPPWMATSLSPPRAMRWRIELDTDLDISRGAVLSEVARRPINADVLEARLVWLAEAPFDPESGYLLAHRHRSHPGDEHEHLCARRFRDPGVGAGACLRRQRHCRLPHPARPPDLARPLLPTCRPPGISSWSAPLMAPPSPAASSPGRKSGAAALGDNVFVLDRELLARGLCSDLGNSPADLAEFHRRAQEAAILLRSVGIPVLIEI